MPVISQPSQSACRCRRLFFAALLARVAPPRPGWKPCDGCTSCCCMRERRCGGRARRGGGRGAARSCTCLPCCYCYGRCPRYVLPECGFHAEPSGGRSHVRASMCLPACALLHARTRAAARVLCCRHARMQRPTSSHGRLRHRQPSCRAAARRRAQQPAAHQAAASPGCSRMNHMNASFTSDHHLPGYEAVP